MDKKPVDAKLAVGGIIVIVVIGIGAVYFFVGQKQSPAQQTAATSTDAGIMTTVTGTAVESPTPANPTPITPASHPIISPGPTAAPAQITINLLTPIANNTWIIGQPNPIAWSNQADITGEIDLLDAQTKKLIGVINSETGPHQTSYSWDARSIYASRYSPIKKDVLPGTYSIRIKFDGNGLSSLVSGSITISN